MWSSLSSYLYGDDGETPPGHVAVHHGRTRGAYPQNGNGSTSTRSSKSSSRGTPRARVESVECRGLQTSLHSTSSNSSGGTRRILQSPSSRLSAGSEAENATTILRAVVVGERRSGKTSLIQRLRGDDPFAKHRASESPRRRKRGTMALIPWNVPNESCCPIATVVQLYVSEGISFNYITKDECREQWRTNLKSQRGKVIDFVIWMIDPRNSESTQALKHGLDLILEESVVKNLCILLNFRDAQSSERTDQESSLLCIRREIECATETLARKNEGVTEPQTIMVYDSSMKNCYGLKDLHSFITLPYLAFLERDLRRRADGVYKQRLQRRSSLLNSPPLPYNEYIRNVSGQANVHQEEPIRAELERQQLEAERERLSQRLKEQNRVLRGRLDTDESVSSNTKPKEVEYRANRRVESTASDQTQRTIFMKPETFQPAKPPKATTPKVVLEETLDSFFSDSESEEEDQVEGVNRSGVTEIMDDEESDDGDFYIDGSGQPQAHTDGRSNAESATEPDRLRPHPSDPATAEVSRSDPAPVQVATEQIESNSCTDEPPKEMREAPEPPDDVSTARAPVHAKGVADQSRRDTDGFQEEKKEEVECGGENRAMGGDHEDSGSQGKRREDGGADATATARARDESSEETGPLEPSAGDPVDISDGDPARSQGDVEDVASEPSAQIGLEDGSESSGGGNFETNSDENSLSANDGGEEDGRTGSKAERSPAGVPPDDAGESPDRCEVPPLRDSEDDAESSSDHVLDNDGGSDPSASRSDAPAPHPSSPQPENSERHYVLDSDDDGDRPQPPKPAVGRPGESPPSDPSPHLGAGTRPSPAERPRAPGGLSAAAAAAIEAARAEAERMAAPSPPGERPGRKSKKSKKKKDGKKKEKRRRRDRTGTEDGE